MTTTRRHFFRKGAVAAAIPFLGYDSNCPYYFKPDVISEPSHETKLVQTTDVIVCGGGPAGFASALAAARSGVKVRLIELQGYLGGVMTAGALTYLLDYENKNGVMAEIVSKLEKSNTCLHAQIFDAEYMKYLLEELCLEAGVEIRYHTRVVAAYRKGSKIDTIITESQSGREAWKAKVFIDATGNGDLGALAGCSFEVGHPVTGKVQPSSMELIVTGLKNEDMLAHNLTIHAKTTDHSTPKKNLFDTIQKAGFKASYGRPVLMPIRNDLFQLGINHEYGVNALDAQSITNATINARRECFRIVDGLRSLGGIWKDIRIVATSDQIGLREGRRIKGKYVITKEDIVKGATFNDAICKVTFPVDIHALDPDDEAYHNGGIRSKPYDIPLRALIAADLDNMLMAGRCISGDFYAHASYRVIGNAIPMGEAAGAYAAKLSRKV